MIGYLVYGGAIGVVLGFLLGYPLGTLCDAPWVKYPKGSGWSGDEKKMSEGGHHC